MNDGEEVLLIQRELTDNVNKYLRYFNRIEEDPNFNFLFTLYLDDYKKQHEHINKIYDVITEIHRLYNHFYTQTNPYTNKDENFSFFTRSLLVYGLKSQLKELSSIDSKEYTEIFVGNDNNGKLKNSTHNCLHSLLKLRKRDNTSHKRIFLLKLLNLKNQI